MRTRVRIRIISGGFHDFIDPVVADYGIEAQYVLANRLIWDDNGVAIGVDQANPLSQDGGKVVAMAGLGS